ncbi:MAG: AAA family ATPase [Oscillospiraceae bacterium]|nr:AAA family ATPase [Oscillospiraceae bacterium]
MKLRKLRASFGRLQNDTLTLHDGLNIVYAPNESGKSTWCAFISAMLYGIDSSERARGDFIPDKQRYAPWSGAPMSGSMELSADGSDIVLQRDTAARNAPMREFSAVYAGTNIPVEGLTGANCGEVLTGVGREVFRRSAFIPQGAVAVSGSPELERRIQAIVSSGDESTSYSEADAKLRGWQHKRRYHRRGVLPELEGEMDEAQRLLDDMDQSVNSVQEMEARLEELREQCAGLEKEVTDARKRQRAEALAGLRKGRAALQQRSDLHDDALAALAAARDELRESEFGGTESGKLEETMAADRAELDVLEDERGQGKSFLPALLFSVLAVATAAAYGIIENVPKLPVIFGAAVFCIAAIVFFVRYSGARQTVHQAEQRREMILRKYKIAVPEDMDAILQRHRELEAAVRRAEAEEQRTREVLARAAAGMRKLEEAAVNDLDFTGGDSEAARLSRRLQAARTEAAELSSRISGLNGKLSAMGDPMVLASSLSSMREEYESIQEEYEAITTAMELLHQADLEIQRRFSPALSRTAAEYFAEMTGGRYQELTLGSDFSARVRAGGDAAAHDAGYLSAGTADLMYLAVRLAVCELALPEGEPCPLVIDDALVNLDEGRYQQAIGLLKEIARERQVVLFTCRKPEGGGQDAGE